MDKLITTYLEMRDMGQFKPSYISDSQIQVMEAKQPFAAFYRFLYREVGEKWRWRDRNFWSDEKLEQWLALPTTSLHVLYVSGTSAGFIELDQKEDATEIVYFGLMERFFGHGYGKHLLSYGIQQAWDQGAKRVWLHTCNLDGPHALHNYQQRGFQIYDVMEVPMPAEYAT